MKKNKKRIKIISKRRFVLNIFIVFFIILSISFFTSKSFGKKEVHTYSYTVLNSDTLWNISENVCNNSGDKNIAIQNVIKDIKNKNNLVDSTIYVGQVLQIPIY